MYNLTNVLPKLFSFFLKSQADEAFLAWPPHPGTATELKEHAEQNQVYKYIPIFSEGTASL